MLGETTISDTSGGVDRAVQHHLQASMALRSPRMIDSSRTSTGGRSTFRHWMLLVDVYNICSGSQYDRTHLVAR